MSTQLLTFGRKFFLLSLPVIFLLGCPLFAEASTLTLAKDGKSNYRIVLVENASETEKFAAEELSRYLSEMSGVRLPIVNLSEAKDIKEVIFVGKSTPDSIRKSLNLRVEDAYLVDVNNKAISLAGASDRASLYAVYDFLETLGIGFARPDQETVPHKSTIELAFFRRMEEPSFSYRAIVLFPLNKDWALLEIDWMAKNRFNWAHLITNTEIEEWQTQEVRKSLMPQLLKRGLHIQALGHSFGAFFPAEYNKEHPEYFSLGPDGVRNTGSRGALCLSNPEVVRVMSENIHKFLAANPEIEIIDLWTNDSASWCYCPGCKKMQGVDPNFSEPRYSYTTRSYLKFVNEVAAKLAVQHPTIRVNALAYHSNTFSDPQVKPAENVFVGFAPWGRACYLGSDDYYVPITEPGPVNDYVRPAMLGWLKLTKNFYIYDYYTASGSSGEIFPIIDTLRKDLAYYKTLGITSMSTETAGCWAAFNVWAAGRLFWNHNVPLKKMVNDFCRISFRDAAEPMTKFYMALESYKWQWREHRPQLAAFIDEAEKLAETDATVKLKLGELRLALASQPLATFKHKAPPPALLE